MEKVALRKRKNMSCNKEEMAIYEVSRGYEIMKLLQLTILFGVEPQGEPPEVLFAKGLQALEMGLSILKYPSDHFNHDHETSSSGCSFSDQGSTAASDEIKSTLPAATGSCKNQLKSMNSWTTVTYSPHDDGYQWRKYGQKEIQRNKLSRSYYRCTYSGQGCQASKQVEEKDCNNEFPLFLVTYKGHHTCKPPTPVITPQVPLPPIEPNLVISFESNSNSNMIFKKEWPMLSSFYSASQQANHHEEVHKTQTPASSSSILNYHPVSLYQTTMGSVPTNDYNHDRNNNSRVSIDHQTTMESVANNEEFSEPMPGTDNDDIFSFACASPPCPGMNMDFSMMDSSATDDIMGFQLPMFIDGSRF